MWQACMHPNTTEYESIRTLCIDRSNLSTRSSRRTNQPTLHSITTTICSSKLLIAVSPLWRVRAYMYTIPSTLFMEHYERKTRRTFVCNARTKRRNLLLQCSYENLISLNHNELLLCIHKWKIQHSGDLCIVVIRRAMPSPLCKVDSSPSPRTWTDQPFTTPAHVHCISEDGVRNGVRIPIYHNNIRVSCNTPQTSQELLGCSPGVSLECFECQLSVVVGSEQACMTNHGFLAQRDEMRAWG